MDVNEELKAAKSDSGASLYLKPSLELEAQLIEYAIHLGLDSKDDAALIALRQFFQWKKWV